MNQKEINKILIDNKKMIEMIASKSYYSKFEGYIDKEDFIQEAFVYASKFLKRYDKRKGSISTFLYANLSKELIRFAHKNISIIKVPVHVYEIVRKVKKYCKQNNIDADNIPDDVIRQFSVNILKDISIIRRIISEGSICKSVDFDTILEKDYYYESYNNVDFKIDNEITRAKINEALCYENERDVKLIKDYYNNGLKYGDLDKKYNFLPRGSLAAITRVRNRLKNKLMKYKEELLND